jgi:hypothetical protein
MTRNGWLDSGIGIIGQRIVATIKSGIRLWGWLGIGFFYSLVSFKVRP